MAATLDARLRLDSSQFSGGLNRALRESNAAVGKMSAQFGTLKNVLGAGIVGSYAASIVGSMFDATIQAEKLQAALSATLGSEGLGKKQLDDIRKMAGDIGLEVSYAAKSMIQFQSAGMSAAEAMRTIKSGFNAVLSSGGGAAEFGLVSKALTQLRSNPKVLQEELNQLRDALPTTAKLMRDTFGVDRAEDFQRLNISGREFVETMLIAMEKLPEIGDTMGKQIGRFSASLENMKAQMGEALKPVASVGMDAISSFFSRMKADAQSWADASLRLQGIDPNTIRAESQARVAREERIKAEQRALEDYNNSVKKGEVTNAKSIADGKTLTGVIAKFDAILKEAAKSARELAAELDFGDRMKAFTDQESGRALEENINRIRDATAESIKAKREAQGDSMPFYGPQQMSSDEAEDWRERVAREAMTPGERKAKRAADREQEDNIRKAADRKTREQMQAIKEEKRKTAFDDLKNNKEFFKEEGTKQQLKDHNRKNADDALKASARTLTDIRDILKSLAVA